MSESAVDEQVEILRELWLTQSDLSFLREGNADLLAGIAKEVRAHRDRVEESLRPVYESMARATKFIPGFMLNKLGRNMSPYVRARIAECMEPKAAASTTKHIPTDELAEISLHLDAWRVAEIAVYQDIQTLTVITDYIAERGLVRRLGEVSDALDEKLLAKLVDRMPDAERLASIAVHMTAKDKLRRIARRIDKKLRGAVHELLTSRGHAEIALAFGE